MFNLYTVTKEKTNCKGFWKDNESGKIFRDNILIKKIPLINKQWENQALFSSGEKAVFYVYGKKAFVEYSSGKIDILRHRITQHENKLRPSLVKFLLHEYGGITIFKNENGYTLEAWTN